MKAVLHANNSTHQTEAIAWMCEGLGHHGISWEIAEYDSPRAGDFAVIWGWRQHEVKDWCRRYDMPLLVMERGYLQPRMEFVSLGWDGLAGRGRYPLTCGDRWEQYWGEMAPWQAGAGYALVCGQVPRDASLYGVDFNTWAQRVTGQLIEQGREVVYRPHPIMLQAGQFWRPSRARLSTGSLDGDLADAAVCVTFNSTTGVESVLAGVPTVACDEGSMAWPVATHDVDDILVTPDRLAWARRLACSQWSPWEIKSGEAWAAIREVMRA